MKIIERVIDMASGETNDIERDMTSQELAEYQEAVKIAEIFAAEKAEADTKKAIAEAKLQALGLTNEDLRALGLG